MKFAWAMLPSMALGHFGESSDFGLLMNEDGEPLPSLEGTWRAPGGRQYVLRRMQPRFAAAVPPNSTYSLDCDGEACGECRLSASYDYETREQLGLSMRCEPSASNAFVEGSLGASAAYSAGLLSWPEGAWRKEEEVAQKSEIHTVHMIYMNHYDVGYTGYVNSVDSGYMHKYFSSAAQTAEEMRQAKSDDKFIYITHPWLVQRFLQCPCPSEKPHPPAPSVDLQGVWTHEANSLERYYVSLTGEEQFSLRCLTGNWTGAASACSIATTDCKLRKSELLCGQQRLPVTAAGDGIGPLRKFTGSASGLWFGPGDEQDYYIMAHNDSNSELTVFWDTKITDAGAWHAGSGTVDGDKVTLLLPEYSKEPLTGTLDDVSIDWGSQAGVWNRHSEACYPKEEACRASSCLARSLGNTLQEPLTCPTQEELATFETAVKKGDIVWHAGPFNIQPENMAPELFDAGVAITRRLDDRYYGGEKLSQTLNLRDLMYSTRSILPLLRKHNITGLTIGSNGACAPPQVPKLHRWLDPATGADVIVAYHPYGYGGYGAGDCAESPNGFALCTEFRSDNTGPPGSVKEVTDSLDSVRKLYPNATVKTSTFDDFIKDVTPAKDELPVVDLEVGDTWVYGNPSDPLKMALNRAVQREWVACLQAGKPECSLENPAIQNMTWWLLKAPEHTWGTPGIAGWGGGDDYDVDHFRAELNSSSYMNAAASWAEQSIYNELAVLALEETQHPLAARARAAVTALEDVQKPDISGLVKQAEPTVPVKLGQLTLAFASDGGLSTLQGPDGVNWASEQSKLAAFVYQTLAEEEWKPFTYAYCTDHKEQAGFCKPGSGNFTESKLWRPKLLDLWVGDSAIIAHLGMDENAFVHYGAPKELFLQVSLAQAEAGWALDVTLSTFGKQPTMVGESQMLTFQPAPKLQPRGSSSAWTLSKLGGHVDPEGVVEGGSQYTHGTWGPAEVQTEAGTLSIDSLDAPNMNPMTDSFPVGNPLPASSDEAQAKAGQGLARLQPGSVKGMAVNLHNNLWNTNYPLYYPFFDARYCKDPWSCKNANLMFRFRISATPAVLLV